MIVPVVLMSLLVFFLIDSGNISVSAHSRSPRVSSCTQNHIKPSDMTSCYSLNTTLNNICYKPLRHRRRLRTQELHLCYCLTLIPYRCPSSKVEPYLDPTSLCSLRWSLDQYGLRMNVELTSRFPQEERGKKR